MVRNLDGLKETISKGDRIDSIINMDPTDFLIMKNQQKMLTSPQLSEYIEKQKRRGFANIKEFESTSCFKPLPLPLLLVVVCLLLWLFGYQNKTHFFSLR